MGRTQRLFPMLTVADLKESVAFYTDVLDAQETYRFPDKDPVFLTLRVGESELGIGYVTGHTLHGQPQRPASGHRIELCVYVADVDAATEAARDAGAPVVVEPVDQAWGERVAYVADPDGNLLMLTAPIARGEG
jgi:lactoylglutathione lyase